MKKLFFVLVGGLILVFVNFFTSSKPQSKDVMGVNQQTVQYTEPAQVTPNSLETIVDNDSQAKPLYFNGYPCTEDCSGHEAGYNWAEEHDIDNIDDCGGNSDSFIEGCQSYVEENYPSSVNNSEDYESDDYQYEY